MPPVPLDGKSERCNLWGRLQLCLSEPPSYHSLPWKDGVRIWVTLFICRYEDLSDWQDFNRPSYILGMLGIHACKVSMFGRHLQSIVHSRLQYGAYLISGQPT